MKFNMAKFRNSKGQFILGNKFNKGIKRLDMLNNKFQIKGTGNSNKYKLTAQKGAMHVWVTKKLGRAKRCEGCHKVGEYINGTWNIDYANLDHSYKRILSDYIGFCRKCHTIYDIIFNNRLKKKHENKKI